MVVMIHGEGWGGFLRTSEGKNQSEQRAVKRFKNINGMRTW